MDGARHRSSSILDNLLSEPGWCSSFGIFAQKTAGIDGLGMINVFAIKKLLKGFYGGVDREVDRGVDREVHRGVHRGVYIES
jgi:hypothetical protein